MTQTLASITPVTNTSPDETLQTFTLDDLAQYTKEGAFGPTASADFRVFFVGRDDVHGVLMHLFSRARLSVKMNMFGYDDDELNEILFDSRGPERHLMVTLDKARPGGAHEKKLLDADNAAISRASTPPLRDRPVGHPPDQPHQGLRRSTARSAPKVRPTGRPQAKAPASRESNPAKSGIQSANNTLAVYINAYEIAKFAARLDYEHAVAAAQPQPVALAK